MDFVLLKQLLPSINWLKIVQNSTFNIAKQGYRSVLLQDWLTLLSFEHPDWFQLLPCSFNVQLHPKDGRSTCSLTHKIAHFHGSI